MEEPRSATNFLTPAVLAAGESVHNAFVTSSRGRRQDFLPRPRTEQEQTDID